MYFDRSEQFGSQLSIMVPLSTPNPVRSDKEALLRDALSSRKVTPIISAAPSKLLHFFQFPSSCLYMVKVGIRENI